MRINGDVLTMTILSGATASNVLDTNNLPLASISNPAALTGTTLTVKGALRKDDATKPLMYCDGATNTAVTIPASAGNLQAAIGDLAAALYGVRYLQLVSNSAEGADRVFYVLLRG